MAGVQCQAYISSAVLSAPLICCSVAEVLFNLLPVCICAAQKLPIIRQLWPTTRFCHLPDVTSLLQQYNLPVGGSRVHRINRLARYFGMQVPVVE